LGDSKKLSRKAREYACALIREQAAAWGIGWASHEEIDRINILNASLLAMQRAFDGFLARLGVAGEPAGAWGCLPLTVIVDGLYTPQVGFPCRALVRADCSVPEVMAASILAKTARDDKMRAYALSYPEYGYEKHKGYPTAEHRKLLALYGPSPIQRRSFKIKPAGDSQLSLGIEAGGGR
jgi:ribonuclease HII